MTQPALNHRLSSMDASFLYFEKKEAPLHIGGISIFQGQLPFEEFRARVNAKMPLLPRYRQKVVATPFNTGHPTWEFDHDFNIERHIYQAEVEAPGTLDQLRELTERIQASMLDRSKPLWELYIVNNLEGDRSAMISKVHHAMVDGISGVDLMNIILDLSPNPAPTPELKVEPVPPRPDMTRSFIDGLLSSAEEQMKSWTDFQVGLLNLTQTWLKEPRRMASRSMAEIMPGMMTPAPILPFNKANSGRQKLAWSDFSFAEARAIRAVLGGTVNDVVLTILSGAVSQYVELHGQKTDGRNMRVMVPVSMRREDQRGALGNLVSILPVEIPLDIADPLERYRYINQKTGTLKGAHLAEGVSVFTALMGIVPPSVQAVMGSLANATVPAVNIVCTNVPGPQIPLYALGRRMVISYPYVPVGFAVGISCAILSYDGKLYFGLTGDAEAAPDIHRLKEFLDQSFVDLREAAEVAAIPAKK